MKIMIYSLLNVNHKLDFWTESKYSSGMHEVAF